MSPREDRLLARLRHGDAVAVNEVFPPTRRAAILAAIVAGDAAAAPAGRPDQRPRPARNGPPSWRRPRALLPVVTAVLACALAVTLVIVLRSAPAAPPNAPAIHASPVSFRYPTHGPDRGFIVATVTQPFAAQSSLDAAFRTAGLDIAVSLVPASPSAVGTVVEISEPAGGPQIETLTGGACVTGGGGPGNCPIGLRIPRDFKGSGAIALGRPARPGEDYESSNGAFAPGESLHCSGLIGTTVAAAKPVLAARGLTVRWRVLGTASPAPATSAPVPTATATATATTSATATATTTSTTASATTSASSSSAEPGGGTAAPGDHIVDGIPIRAGVVMLQAQPAPLSTAQLAQESKLYDGGCPA